ncbi:response regulator transcription factor [Arsenicitalea aurantiaca]|uniref:Response regulator transcription factor n=1 Tax=Arsenicitalea aurantiaca TaxID=1783274 RepID=A0A433X2E5_9HYPH|nr:response regulator transcription factor [Arsenicitalea aurantiaca]RUT28264.1 response regulator transcription factor [Arsenicitalea aurantiaca]
MTVLIAEDDPVYRSFIRDAIAESSLGPIEVLEASDGETSVALALEGACDYIVLDLQLPRLSGVECARQIWAHRPQTRVLFWSNFGDEAYVRSLARIVPREASYGYLLKSSAPERLRVAIDGVFLDGQCIIDREIRGIQARAQGWREALNDAEYDMLVDISLGFTDQKIAERHGLSTRGVQSRLQKLYTKLGVLTEYSGAEAGAIAVFNPRTRAICVAILRGMINADLVKRAGQIEAAL